MKNLIIALSTAAILLTSCGNNPVDSTEHKPGSVETGAPYIKKSSFGRNIDTDDTFYTPEIREKVKAFANQANIQSLEIESITPDTMQYEGKTYILGFYIRGKEEVEVTEVTTWETGTHDVIPNTRNDYRRLVDITQLEKKCDEIVGMQNSHYQRMEMNGVTYIVDTVDLPRTEEMTHRIDELNSTYKKDVYFMPLPQLNQNRTARTDERGNQIINGVALFALGPGAGDSSMECRARAAVTGENNTTCAPPSSEVKLRN